MKQNKTPYLTKFAKMQKKAGVYSKIVKALIKVNDTAGISRGTLKGILENNPELRKIDGVLLDPKSAYPHVAKGLKEYTNKLINYENNAKKQYNRLKNIVYDTFYQNDPSAANHFAYLANRGNPFEKAQVQKLIKKLEQNRYDKSKFLPYWSDNHDIGPVYGIRKLVTDMPKYKSSLIPFVDKLKDIHWYNY